MNPLEMILGNIRDSDGIFGLQETTDGLYHEVDALVDRGEATYRRIVTMQARVDTLRAQFDKSRVKTDDCEPDRQSCRERRCTCSYADMRELVTFEKSLASLNRKFNEICRAIRDMHAASSRLIWLKIQALLHDTGYLTFLAEALHLCGEISFSQHLLMDLPGFFRFDGTPGAIRLHFGQDPIELVVLMTERRRTNEGR